MKEVERYTKDAARKIMAPGSDGERENIKCQTYREVCQNQEKSMSNQGSDVALAPRAGFEPATNRLTAGCSTAELTGTTLASLRF